MYPDSTYFGLKVVPIHIGTLGPKCLLYRYMDPLKSELAILHHRILALGEGGPSGGTWPSDP